MSKKLPSPPPKHMISPHILGISHIDLGIHNRLAETHFHHVRREQQTGPVFTSRAKEGPTGAGKSV